MNHKDDHYDHYDYCDYDYDYDYDWGYELTKKYFFVFS